MSVTAEPAYAPAPVQGWTTGRARRARMFAALLVPIALLALWSAWQPWYSSSVTGTASCGQTSIATTVTVRTTTTNTAVAGVDPSACATGRDIALQNSNEGLDPTVVLAMQQLDMANDTKPPAVLFGLPRPVPMVVISILIGIVGLASRNGIFGMVAIVGFYYAHGDLEKFQETMLDGDGGAMNVALPGLQLFGWALVLGWGLVASATLFVAKHNAAERGAARRAALAAGETPPPTMLEHGLGFVGKGVGVVMTAADRERNHAKTVD